ncbi:MAG: hypothetical protein IT178_08635 [Acidobacteria bacterium]|nr:hypothetical protein [Acidobacteriota bacterium]
MAELRDFTRPLDNVLRVANLGTTHLESLDLPEGVALGSGDIDPLTGHYFLITDGGTGEFARGPLRLLGLKPWRGSLLRFSPDGAYAYLCTGAVGELRCLVVRRADEVVVAVRERVERIAFDGSGGHVVTRTATTRAVEYAAAADPSVVVWSTPAAGAVAVHGDRIYVGVATAIQALESASGQVVAISAPGRGASHLAASATRVFAVSEQVSNGIRVVYLASYDTSTLTMETEVVVGPAIRPPVISDLSVTADDAAVVISSYVTGATSGSGLHDPVTLAPLSGGGGIGIGVVQTPVISADPLCRLAVSPTAIVLPDTGGMLNLNVTPDPGCGPWPVATTALHGHIAGPPVRTGPGVVTAWFAPNTSVFDLQESVIAGGVRATVQILAPTSAPNAPIDVRIDRTSPSGRVHWLPAGTGSMPTGFIVEGGRAGAPPTARVELSGSARSFDMPPLGAGDYVVQVRARNAVGEGPPSAAVRFDVGATLAPEAPIAMAVATDASVIRATWTPSPTGSAPQRFLIEAAPVSPAPGSAFVPVAMVGAGETSWAFAVPAPVLGAYRLRVRAENTVGRSAPSNAVDIVTSACTVAPAAPTALRATSTGPVVTLAWDAPAGGAESFVLEVGSQPQQSDLGVLPTATPSLALSVPAPAGHYFVQVRGRNACGLGAASAPAYVVVVR